MNLAFERFFCVVAGHFGLKINFGKFELVLVGLVSNVPCQIFWGVEYPSFQ